MKWLGRSWKWIRVDAVRRGERRGRESTGTASAGLTDCSELQPMRNLWASDPPPGRCQCPEQRWPWQRQALSTSKVGAIWLAALADWLVMVAGRRMPLVPIPVRPTLFVTTTVSPSNSSRTASLAESWPPRRLPICLGLVMRASVGGNRRCRQPCRVSSNVPTVPNPGRHTTISARIRIIPSSSWPRCQMEHRRRRLCLIGIMVQ